jgi:RNA polymerase sigma-70 factor (sigma-E family)
VTEQRSAAEAGFDEFAVAAWPRLRWTAVMLTGDDHLAEDLAQTALERTYASWRRVRRDEAFGYARRVLVNANIDRLRKRRLRELPGGQPPDRAAPYDVTSAVEDADLLVRLRQQLGAQERRVVVLRHYYDLTEAAVAQELGISVGTVKSTASRALAKLRAEHPALAGLRG